MNERDAAERIEELEQQLAGILELLQELPDRPPTVKLALLLHRKWIQGEEGGVRLDLSKKNMERADFTAAKLAGAQLANASMVGADLNGANLAESNLTTANLRRAVLTEADLSHADLRHADLSGADLSNANLFGAKLPKEDASVAKPATGDVSNG